MSYGNGYLLSKAEPYPISNSRPKPHFWSLSLISPLVRRTNRTLGCTHVYTLLIPGSIH